MALKFKKSSIRKSFDAEKRLKEFISDNQTYNVGLIPFKIKISDKAIKIFTKKTLPKKLVNSFSLNHIMAYHLTDSSTEGIDRCRVFANPFGIESVFVFHSPQYSSEFENSIIQARKDFISQCSTITFMAFIENTDNKLKPSATMRITGISTGKEIKLWIEKEFKLPDIHTENYILGVVVNEKFHVLKDEMCAFVLYNHLENSGTSDFCGKGCFDLPQKKSLEEIYLQIRLNNEISKLPITNTLYSVEKYCPDRFLPRWLLRLLSNLYYGSPGNIAVFRITGKPSTLVKWYEYMLKYDDFIIRESICHQACILKYFLRKIDGSIMGDKTLKQFEILCKSFVSRDITAEKFISDETNKLKLIMLVRSAPRTNLYILQHILVVIEAILNHKDTVLTALSLAKSMAPSLFPLTDTSLWSYTPTMLAAIFLLSEEIVQDFARHKILKDFASVSDSDSISLFSTEDDYSKQIKLNSEESMSVNPSLTSDVSHVDHEYSNVEIDVSVSSNKDSLFNSESLPNSNKISVFTPIEEESEQPFHSSPNKFYERYQNNFQFDSLENLTNDDNDIHSYKSNESDMEVIPETSEYFPSNSNSNLNKSICMGLKMKEILNDKRKTMDFDLSLDLDVKENVPICAQRDKICTNQRHKSLINPEMSGKDINRSASIAILSPGCSSLRNNDSIGSATNEIKRKNSRKATSELHESNCAKTTDRSRSPVNIVKTLVEVYENKCKGISSEDNIPPIKNNQKKLHFA